MNIQNLHNVFSDILYYDKGHRYFKQSTGEPLLSVTQVIKRFQEPFDTEYWTKYKAKEWDTTPDKVKYYWEHLRIIGAERGTLIHNYLEEALKRKKYPIEYPNYIKLLPALEYVEFHRSVLKMKEQADNFIKDFSDYNIVANELVAGTDKVAGQIDFLTDRCIIDFKTDKKIDTSNVYQNFKAPIDHLQDCRYNKYCLQVSLYRYILESAGFDLPEPDKIIWINHNNENYKVFTIPYLKEECELILKTI